MNMGRVYHRNFDVVGYSFYAAPRRSWFAPVKPPLMTLQVVKGSWIVRQSVGTTPVLLGQKLLTRYFRQASLQRYTMAGPR